jgi:hypothetical protein
VRLFLITNLIYTHEPGNSVGIGTGYAQPVLRLTQPYVKWVTGVLSPGIKPAKA